MKSKLSEIERLCRELQEELPDENTEQFNAQYGALELPSIVSAIVEHLHPALTPYEIALYWYLFNKSIVATGDQYARASTRGMSDIAQSSSGQSSSISYGAIKKTVDGLVSKGVLSVAGDTNREGTLYRVSIPEEIELCQEHMRSSAESEAPSVNIENELDFYNIPENRKKVFERDAYQCHYCSKQLTRFSATLDHIQPVSEGGDNSYQNLVTACLHCNSERGAKPIMEFVTRGT